MLPANIASPRASFVDPAWAGFFVAVVDWAMCKGKRRPSVSDW
jgi:hypothetical protein